MSRNIIAILRGIKPEEVEEIVSALLEQGIDKIEVPLNSPSPFESIERIINRFSGQGIFGAGTVLKEAEVDRLAQLGANMVVSPNCDPHIIQATKAAGMQSYPGVMTPSECFSALNAGADGLKIFPGELVTPKGLKAIRAVLPREALCFAVGGATPDNFAQWREAGANGFGVGSAIYKPNDSVDVITTKAKAIVKAYDEVML